MDIVIATEDALSEQLVESLLCQSGRGYNICNRLRRAGSGYLKSSVAKFNQMAEQIPIPVLLLIDLDQSPCLVELKHKWLPAAQSLNLLFRVAVREAESWVLADRSAFAGFLGIGEARVPLDPDILPDPKQSLLELVSHSRKRSLRQEILPAPNSTSPVGLGYNENLCRFVAHQWSVERAIANSPSLFRTWLRICEFEPAGY